MPEDVTIKFSALEIYNDKLIDLLSADGFDESSISGGEEDYDDISTTAGGGGASTSKSGAASTDVVAPRSSTTSASTSSNKHLEIRESRSFGIYVKGLRCQTAETVTEALDLLFESQMNRAIAEHQVLHVLYQLSIFFHRGYVVLVNT